MFFESLYDFQREDHFVEEKMGVVILNLITVTVTVNFFKFEKNTEQKINFLLFSVIGVTEY